MAFLLSYVFHCFVSSPLESVRGAGLNHTNNDSQESYLFEHCVFRFLEGYTNGLASGPNDVLMVLQITGLASRCFATSHSYASKV